MFKGLKIRKRLRELFKISLILVGDPTIIIFEYFLRTFSN